MLSDSELKLLKADIQGFPMIKAASAALARCGTCGHKNVNINSILRIAVTKYRQNPKFIAECKKIIKLPCMLGGILVTG